MGKFQEKLLKNMSQVGGEQKKKKLPKLNLLCIFLVCLGRELIKIYINL